MTGLVPLLVRVGPLALGAAVSPTLLLVQMLVLTRGPARLARAWLYTLGAFLMTAVWMAVGIAAFSTAAHHAAPSAAARTTSGIVHVLAAGLLLMLAVKNFYVPEGEVAPDKVQPDDAAPHYLKALLLGVGLMASNITTVVLLLPATHEVATSRAALSAKAAACAVLAVAAVLPALLPPLLVTLGGSKGRAALDRLAGFMARHQHRIGAVVCVAFALYLGISGWAKLR